MTNYHPKKQNELSSSFQGPVLQAQPRTVATLKLFPAHFQGEKSLLTLTSKKNKSQYENRTPYGKGKYFFVT